MKKLKEMTRSELKQLLAIVLDQIHQKTDFYKVVNVEEKIDMNAHIITQCHHSKN
jgi:hypothetical protein